jgi:hypothetical protein
MLGKYWAMTRAIILAAGESERWKNYLGVPKHLIPIKGEPLIHRTQRLLKENKVDDIRVVCNKKDKQGYVAEYSFFEEPVLPERSWIQEWDGSRHLWNNQGKTIILYGDCYFTESLIKEMCKDVSDPWKAYARWSASNITGKGYDEMFGWCFLPQHHQELDAARERAIEMVNKGSWWRCLGWEVYRSAVGLPIEQYGGKEDVHAKHWHDESEDFDVPEDWNKWSSLNPGLV